MNPSSPSPSSLSPSSLSPSSPSPPRPLRRVFVANRGEIALRVIRACHAAGIEAVAGYSDADADASWVRAADSAAYLGRSPAHASYLNADAVLRTARAAGADAIHPGYGFLSENAAFARRVAAAGLVFVGPPPDVMELLGDKAAARGAARRAGLPVVSGSGPVAGAAEARSAASVLGCPLLVKAVAGGGGRGVRLVREPAELERVLHAARREAAASFGDGRVYLERVVEPARHVEVQVLADARGGVVHAHERECSVQRRRQKLVEEAPAPGLAEATRAGMAEAAVRLAAYVGYRGVGTVEFLLEEDGSFAFMEMNTRIQVEHPVTECVTGLDLVGEQLRLAGGELLPAAGPDLSGVGASPAGAAIELRINAEDPYDAFRPTPGRLERFELPAGPGVRVDTGYAQGERIPPFYDSLLAKLICRGADRPEAHARARRALAELHIAGPPTTAALYERVLAAEELRTCAIHTGWLEEWLTRR